MVMDPPPPTPPAHAAPEKPGRPGMGLLPIALGVGLLAAAVVVSGTRSRSDGDLDWSNYSVGLGATAALLLVAIVALMVGSEPGRENLVTWPGSIGVLGAGAMLGVGLEDIDGSEDWLAYLVGGVIVLLSAVGYAAVRRGAFAVTAILGLGIAYIQLADDVLVDIGDEDDQAIIAAVTIAVFVLVVTAVGWLLRARALIGVIAGVVGVVGLNAVLLVLVVSQFFDALFGGSEMFYTETRPGDRRSRSVRRVGLRQRRLRDPRRSLRCSPCSGRSPPPSTATPASPCSPSRCRRPSSRRRRSCSRSSTRPGGASASRWPVGSCSPWSR